LQGGQRLQQQGRLADARIAADQDHRAGHDAAAQHPVQLVQSGGDARAVLFPNLAQGLHGAGGHGRGAATARLGRRQSFGQGVPGAAFAALARPLGKLGAAVLAEVCSLAGGEGFRHWRAFCRR